MFVATKNATSVAVIAHLPRKTALNTADSIVMIFSEVVPVHAMPVSIVGYVISLPIDMKPRELIMTQIHFSEKAVVEGISPILTSKRSTI